MELDEFQSDRLSEISPEQTAMSDGQQFLRSLHAWLKTNPPMSRVQDMRIFMASSFETVLMLTATSSGSNSLGAAYAKPILDAALRPPGTEELSSTNSPSGCFRKGTH